MGLRIIYGKPGTGKSTFCFSEISKLIKTEKKIYIITPEQFSYTAERKLMDAINTKAVLNAEVITLSRMAYRVMDKIGGANKTQLSASGKAMLIYSILSKNKGNLKFLGKTDENIELCMRSITEFKKHQVTVDALKNEAENIEDKFLKTKLEDMLIIYEGFENQIKEQYIEETDALNILAQHIDETDIINDSIIYIDEFAGFTTQEYEVIKKFILIAKQVNITLCINDLERNTNPDTDIFYSNKKTLSRLVEIVDENGLKLEEPIYLEKEYRFKTDELKYIADNLYSTNIKKYSNDVEHIRLFLAKNYYSEIENVAQQITKLVRDKGLRYKDISVITKCIPNYSSLVRSIFSSYNIPVFIDEKRDLNQNVIVQYVLGIVEILTKNFSNEAIFSYLKLGFADIEKDDIFKLENYATKWGIKRTKWKDDFKYGLQDESKKQEIEYLNEIRKQVIEPLFKLKQEITKEKTVAQITKILYEFLQEQNIEEKILQKIDYLKTEGFIDLSKEYEESYKVILNIFDEIVLVFGDEKITYDKYYQLLKVGLKNSGIGKIPGTSDQVIFGDVERSRNHKVDTVFIIGLNDGIFPSVNKDEGFLNDQDRERLRTDDIELANGTIDNLYEENFNIYKAFTTAEKNIFLSYSSSDSEGTSLRPSMLINKIKRLFENLEEQSDIIKKNYEIINEKVTYEELLENIAKLRKNEDIDELWYNIYAYFKTEEHWNKKLINDLEGLNFTNLPKQIKSENIDKLYGNTLNTSISRLEQYRKCPFSYYLQYGLKLKEKEELKVQTFDTGTFMHNTIDEFFKIVRKENIGLGEIEEEKVEEIVSEIIESSLKNQKNFIFTATAKYKMLVVRLKKIVAKALKYIIQSLIYSDFNIEGTEIEFSKNGKYEPIMVTLENGKRVELTGKIDRIDTARDEDGKYLRIIDYKSSAKDIDFNEVYAGLQIQLLTYTDAVCKKGDFIPTGAFYFPLIEQMITADKKMTDEEIEEAIQKNFRMKGLILADVKVIKMHDNTLESGASKIVPAAITTKGAVRNDWTKGGVTSEEFNILQKYIYKTIKQISKEILAGKIDIKPYNKEGENPCKYCKYKSICGFNTKNENNKYNYIDKKTKDTIILKMKKDIEVEGRKEI